MRGKPGSKRHLILTTGANVLDISEAIELLNAVAVCFFLLPTRSLAAAEVIRAMLAGFADSA